MLNAVYKGKITIENKELDCAVLSAGTRILTNTAARVRAPKDKRLWLRVLSE